jgi:hypothetical protein
MNEPKGQPIWWERFAAVAALIALGATLATSQMSCGGADLFIPGSIPPTLVPTSTGNATATPTPTDEEEVEDDFI